MLTVLQAAERAGVSEALVRAWVADGSLPHYRLGRKGSRGKIMIAAADLDGLLSGFKVEASVPRPKPVKPAPLKHLRRPS